MYFEHILISINDFRLNLFAYENLCNFLSREVKFTFSETILYRKLSRWFKSCLNSILNNRNCLRKAFITNPLSVMHAYWIAVICLSVYWLQFVFYDRLSGVRIVWLRGVCERQLSARQVSLSFIAYYFPTHVVDYFQ